VEVRTLDNIEAIKSGQGNQKTENQDVFSELFAALFANIQSPRTDNAMSSQNSADADSGSQQSSRINPNDLSHLINQMKLDGSFKSLVPKGIDFTTMLEELGLNGDVAAMSEKLDLLLKQDLGKPEQMLKLLNGLSIQSVAETDLSSLVNKENVNSDIMNVANSSLETLESQIDNMTHDKIQLNTNTESAGLNQDEIKNTSLPHIENTNINKVSGDVKVDAKEIVNITKAEDLVEVVVNRFKSLRLPEITELRVKLRPEDLGDITVKVVLEKGQINGTIQAEKREVVNMLQSQMDNLKQDLKNNNVNLNHISVNIESDGSFEGRNQRHFAQDQRRNGRQVIDVFEENKVNNIEEGFDIIA
jgi:flagellar hook-length control protein FliK